MGELFPRPEPPPQTTEGRTADVRVEESNTTEDIRVALATELLEKMAGRLLYEFKGTEEELKAEKDKLKQALADFVSRFVDIEMENTKLEEDGHHNPLTKVLNRAGAERVFDLLKTEQHRKPADGHLVIVRLDLDNFKKINDLGGHQMGDTLLKAVADRLREYDILIHFSGDEFGIILQNIKPYSAPGREPLSLDETIKIVLTRVVRKIEEVNKDIVAKESKLGEISVTASVGYKTVGPEDLSNGHGFSHFDSLADNAASFAKKLKGTGKPATERIIGSEDDRQEILEKLGVTEASLDVAIFKNKIGRAIGEAKEGMSPEEQEAVDRNMEEIEDLILNKHRPSSQS